MEYPELKRVISVIKALRDPKTGCPWDLKQNHRTLTKYLIEESYEYIHAVDEKNPQMMKEELGDVLLQVLLNSQVASDEKLFNIEDVAKTLADKMIERHPHVFKNPGSAASEEEALASFKAQKKKKDKKNTFTTEDAYLPSLLASFKIGEKSKTINFDWENVSDVLAKVEEELEEVKVEIKEQDHLKAKEEIGDLLFSVAQLARHLEINPEDALKQANLKFIRRINKVEDAVVARGKNMNNLSVNELEDIWQEIKKAPK